MLGWGMIWSDGVMSGADRGEVTVAAAAGGVASLGGVAAAALGEANRLMRIASASIFMARLLPGGFFVFVMPRGIVVAPVCVGAANGQECQVC